ncbi:unnamed protein product [Microthlaspi erraticum]|uniref:Uncharacterized protein n=1 Tax=Microthlaspi erraticum TaxID=1685480 RepID=A0A6D2ITT5_9BRAS|nr:unnamed protein product [Microthlaspi erraticum]
MDFIKTSSLRALIELTFQRNWNGLIWMSRKGVITKRVRLSRRLYRENSAQPRSPAGRELCSRSAKVTSVRLKSRPKSKPTGRSRNDPGNIVPRSAKPNATPRRARPKRASRETSLAAAQPVPRATSEPGKNVPRPAENFIGQISSARPRRPTANPSDPDRSDSPTTRLSGRSSRRPSQRRGRPEALFEAQTYVFKPGLTLSRL